MWYCNRQWRLLLLSFVGLFLSACSVKPPVAVDYNVEPLWQQHLAALERLAVWSFDGRIAVRDGRQAWNAKISWAQRDISYDILIAAPFGQGAARLSGQPGRALIDVSGRAPLVAEDPGALLSEQLGWAVPVAALQYWLTGRPDPQASAALSWDELGRVIQLDQSGWTVTYKRYDEGEHTPGGVSLPTKIELVKRDLRIKIVVDQWHVGPDE